MKGTIRLSAVRDVKRQAVYELLTKQELQHLVFEESCGINTSLRFALMPAMHTTPFNKTDRNDAEGLVELMRIGLFTGSAATRGFPEIVREIIQENSSVAIMLAPLFAVHDALLEQIKIYENELKNFAKNDPAARRIMTGLGVSICRVRLYDSD